MRAALFFMAFWSCATRVCADTSLLPPGPLCGPGVFSSSAESAARLMRAQTTRQHPPVNRTLTEQHRRAPAATRPIALLPAIRDKQGARDAASARAQSILAARGSRHAGLPSLRQVDAAGPRRSQSELHQPRSLVLRLRMRRNGQQFRRASGLALRVATADRDLAQRMSRQLAALRFTPLRTAAGTGHDRLRIVGGADHKTGEADDAWLRFEVSYPGYGVLPPAKPPAPGARRTNAHSARFLARSVASHQGEQDICRCESRSHLATGHRKLRPRERTGTKTPRVALADMFFFFSNSVGLIGSIVVSVLLTLLLLYACSQ